MDVADRVRGFLRDEVVLDANAPLDDDTQLLEGILDSLGLMQLVAFLEEEYETEIDDVDVTSENFRTIADIARLIDGRLARA
jgi:acyl carrier protein